MNEYAEKVREQLGHPVLHPSFVAVEIDRNTLHIRGGPWSGPAYTLRDDQQENGLGDLPSLLDGDNSVEAVLDHFEDDQREEIARLLLELAEKDIVLDASEVQSAWPHDAIRRPFSRRNRENVESASASIVTVGDIGRQIAADLLDMGVDEVTLFQPLEEQSVPVDSLREDDRFEDYGAADIALATVVEDAEFVVYAAEGPHPDLLEEVNRAALDTSTPWLASQVYGVDGIVGPLMLPNDTACYECFERRTLANVSSPDGYRAYLQAGPENPTLTKGRFPALARQVAGYTSLDLLNYFAFGRGFTTGRVVTVNGLDLSVEANDVLKLPRCPTCGPEAGQEVQRFMSDRDFSRIVMAERNASETESNEEES